MHIFPSILYLWVRIWWEHRAEMLFVIYENIVLPNLPNISNYFESLKSLESFKLLGLKISINGRILLIFS